MPPEENPPQALAITVHPDGDRVVVRVCGELDLDTVERFQEVLGEAVDRAVGGVDLDFGNLAFCDCSALNTLLRMRLSALEQDKTLALRSAGPAVERLLAVTGTRELFPGPDADGSPNAPAPAPDEEPPGGLDEELRVEVAQLRRAMQTRPTIDLARGILMASFSLSSDEAWAVLVTASQNTNTKLHRLAGHLVSAVKGDALPREVQEQLSSAVTRVHTAAVGAPARDPDRVLMDGV